GKGKLIFQKITSVISRHQTERLNSFLFLYFHFQKDGFRQSLLTHGFYNPRCSKDGKTSHNPKSRIECLLASASPSGAEMVTLSVPQNPASPAACRTASVIILLGTLLMAGAPTGCSSPDFVTRPIPSPPSST